MKKKNPHAVALGRRGGQVKSEAKAAASRANAKRPRKGRVLVWVLATGLALTTGAVAAEHPRYVAKPGMEADLSTCLTAAMDYIDGLRSVMPGHYSMLLLATLDSCMMDGRGHQLQRGQERVTAELLAYERRLAPMPTVPPAVKTPDGCLVGPSPGIGGQKGEMTTCCEGNHCISTVTYADGTKSIIEHLRRR